MTDKRIAGMSIKGGRRENFYFCMIEYFSKQDRWFLRSMLQVKEEEELGGEDAVRGWIEENQINKLVIDSPLSNPACHSCELDCPGIDKCEVEDVKSVREGIQDILDHDIKLRESNPKKYEQDRNLVDEVNHSRDPFSKIAKDHMLSRSFKRRLKKGYLPYWNRSLDFWVWSHYYDQLLDIFNISYDSFGNTSIFTQSRLAYLRRHFPNTLELFESNVQISLIEMMRNKIILKRDILQMSDIEMGVEARLDIIKKIEKNLNIFIYENDLELIVKNPRAFDSFLLAISGQKALVNQAEKLPLWTLPKETNFLIPKF